MSFGLHRLWKDILVAKVRPVAVARLRPSRRRRRHGRRRLPRRARRRSADVGDRRRHQRRHAAGRRMSARESAASMIASLSSKGNAEALPFADARFDAYTIAFGIRNVPRIEEALAEAYRVLKRGGRFLCLEFSRVDLPVLDRSVRRLFLRRHSGARQGRGRRRRALSLSRRIDPQVSPARSLRRHDRRGRLRARRAHAA